MVAGRATATRHAWAGQWRRWAALPGEFNGEMAERILVLYGGVPVRTLLDLQGEDVRVVFGHLVDELLAPRESEREERGSMASLVMPAMLADEVPVGIADSLRRADMRLPEQVVREAAERILDQLPPGAEVGRLGRRKRPVDPNTYVAQYVHFEFKQQPLAIWIYYATADDGYSAPKAGDGYWVGLKQDAARELRELEWATAPTGGSSGPPTTTRAGAAPTLLRRSRRRGRSVLGGGGDRQVGRGLPAVAGRFACLKPAQHCKYSTYWAGSACPRKRAGAPANMCQRLTTGCIGSRPWPRRSASSRGPTPRPTGRSASRRSSAPDSGR